MLLIIKEGEGAALLQLCREGKERKGVTLEKKEREKYYLSYHRPSRITVKRGEKEK